MASSQQYEQQEQEDNHNNSTQNKPSPAAAADGTVMNHSTPSSSSDPTCTAAAAAASTRNTNPDNDAILFVPQLVHHKITYHDLDTAIRVLNAVASLNQNDKKNKKRRNHNTKQKQQQQEPQTKKRPPPSPQAETTTVDSSSSSSSSDPHQQRQQQDQEESNMPNNPADKCSRNDNGDSNNNNNNNNITSGLDAYKHRNLRLFRKSLAACLELHQRTMYDGLTQEAYYQLRNEKRTLKRQKTAETAQQQKYIATTTLRRGRVEKLQQLLQQQNHQNISQDEANNDQSSYKALLIPDGHVDTTTTTTAATITTTSQQRLLENHDNSKTDGADNNNNKGEQQEESKQQDPQQQQQQLPKLRSCYVCKVRFRELHHFYDQLCPPCATLNWRKRHQMANLQNRVAVVTGARVKIGYQVCLKLLRAGCHVVATTRFPNTAVSVYRQEHDFDEWKHRLQIYGLDLRDVVGLEAFTRFLKLQFGQTGIDILINNACQTIRRPAAYYTPVVEQEQTLWNQADETHKTMLSGCMQFERLRRQILLEHKQLPPGAGAAGFGGQDALSMLPSSPSSSPSPSSAAAMDIDDTKPTAEAATAPSFVQGQAEPNTQSAAVIASSTTSLAASTNESTTCSTSVPFETTGLSHSAAMSQMIILSEDSGVSDSILPPGVTDINGQQLDLRISNSWLLKMEQVSTPEIMECMFVNAIAPFVLNSRLKPLMTIPQDDDKRPDRYIINVSAMEGKFYRYKMPNHPHTNMAKAALNMLTRTSAEDLATKHRIYMNSVDTGWINDENPLERASQTAKNNHFQTPIDEIDAAARILDPVFVGFNLEKETEKHQYGKFLKDYHETEW